MKLTKNDNRKPMNDIEANLFAFGGISTMLFIAPLPILTKVGLGGAFGCLLLLRQINK